MTHYKRSRTTYADNRTRTSTARPSGRVRRSAAVESWSDVQRNRDARRRRVSRPQASGFSSVKDASAKMVSAIRWPVRNSKPFANTTSWMRDTRERKRRQRTKARASKQFERQYAFRDSSRASAEGAPRAALYKGEMGPSQRKSARLQRSSEATPAIAKFNPAGWFSNFRLTGRSARLITVVACVVLTFVFLYTPARHYYQAQRELDRIQAEYIAVEQRNHALDAQNDALASDAGMQDAVRVKYGYIMPGEQTAVVTGLSDEATDTSNDSNNIEANVLSSTVKAPEEWYTPYLDAFFGVE